MGRERKLGKVVEVQKLDGKFFSPSSEGKKPIDRPVFEFGNLIWSYFLLPFLWIITIQVIVKKKIYRGRAEKGGKFNTDKKRRSVEFAEDGSRLKENEEEKRLLPKINSFFFDGIGEWLSKDRKLNSPMVVKLTAGTVLALEEIYHYRFRRHAKKWGDRLAILYSDFCQWSLRNTKGVRNRFKLVREIVWHNIDKQCRLHPNEEIRIVSLACGSAEAILEMAAEYKVKGVMVKTMLVDINPVALEYAKKIAERLGVLDRVMLVEGNAISFSRLVRRYNFKPHIVEMLGLMDYLNDQVAALVCKQAQKVLETGGVFLTCNILPNIEMWFVKHVINWEMIHRSVPSLFILMKQVGFTGIVAYVEPNWIHAIIVAEVSNQSRGNS